MTARLIQLSPPAEYPLDGSGTLIGRGLTAAVRVQDPSISREHARILRKAGVWQILDLGSANGTLVNEMPVRGMSRLEHGDTVRLGAVKFKFQREGEALKDLADTLNPAGATFLSVPESRQVVFLVADLKGFTPLSAKLAPPVLAAAVRYWCDQCRSIVEAHGAVLDKFIGDCAFAWWSGCGPEVRHQAVLAARALLAIPAPPEALLECGVALHCGEAALCRMPDASFTLLGSEVNATFRMESLTRQLGHHLLASGAFVENWPDPPCRFVECGQYQLKGIEGSFTVHAVDPELVDKPARV